ncbi:MAG: hypothetical protein A3G32_06050 [Deltaproteobacteria bacterium RIFCSPLOWO2_12_FULL_40_28]|nr:MAG: hypothetical protein A3C45_04860 [Deltaproteobacteria bacterium RIFCSPHIGHO2_02_FULL_40_28]OGQ20250.1 MAG: hypothetical protein A3E27_05960 [Deltaproteobacteria bacterium RIFCSPHIGHO2_12_FULL_40_32]OGQ40369.1 MAG: hypothetical protein A3I69_09015 [Deltaproteobacteria bacterium RIFCSPLOWO2_02_FULL_40_36]OGQ54826.1 MAG: hypothetical protein A3G32_06050 [Deltaproteobacteria bacterium RIFCSPLOWO2_12_FULL_40_28]
MIQKITKIWIIVIALFLAACGGGENNSTSDIAPSISPTDSDDLASLVVNTFVPNGINITVDPTYFDMGVTSLDDKLTQTFILYNNSGEDKYFTLTINGTAGGFRFRTEDGDRTAYYPNYFITSGSSQEFTIEFDASLMGTRQAKVVITALNTNGTIELPFRASVTGGEDFSVIPSSYLCSGESNPTLTEIDFLKVASGRSKTQSFKICNTGGEDIIVNRLALTSTSSGLQSASLSSDLFEEFAWEVENTLNSAYFDYYNPSSLRSFTEPTLIPYTGTIPDPVTAFGVVEHSTGGAIENIIVASGSYARFDVEFAPTLEAEAPEGQLYEPINYAAKLQVETSLGPVDIELMGATSGKEPVLEITYLPEGSTTTYTLDTESLDAAINFGTSSIFEDWITEDSREVTLTLSNVGSGSKNLDVWLSEITSGYFTYVEGSTPTLLPLEIATGRSEQITLTYAPTPEEVSSTYDLGQLTLMHTGGNGPQNRVTLVGEQDASTAVEVYQGVIRLKSSYEEGKTQNLCVFQIGTGTTKEFTIKNNSSLSGNTLTTSWSLGDTVGVSASPSSGSVSVEPGQESTFSVTFTPTGSAVDGDVLTATLSIENHFALESQYGITLPTYTVPLKATASTTGICTGGDGTPTTEMATMVVDRITMILAGVAMPATNPTAFKLQIPVYLDSTNNYAAIGEVPYDYTQQSSSNVSIFRPYNHEGSNITGDCYPLPDNPYATEDGMSWHANRRTGSWFGPARECTYEFEGRTLYGNEVGIPENGAQVVSENGENISVFYHEFVKFPAEGSCTPEIEGKIATFHLKPGETIPGKFQEMEDKAGIDGSQEEYEAINRTYQFDSYLQFNSDYASGDCVHSAGDTVSGDPEAIKVCWEAFKNDSSLIPAMGMREEYAYFFFVVEQGCIPQNAPGVANAPAAYQCSDATPDWNDKDTWTGFGEYESYADPKTGDIDDTKRSFTVRNVHLQGFFVTHSLNSFYGHSGKLLYSDLYATLTTKAVGGDNSSDDWQDLIAVNNRSDFEEDDIFTDINSDSAHNFWTEDGTNSEFTAGGDDDVDCFDETGTPKTLTSCRGNYMITSDAAQIMSSGEPYDFVNGKRGLLTGIASFHGRDQLAPSFAREADDGTGRALIFTLHSCIYEGEPGTDVDSSAGCYDYYWDNEEYRQAYVSHGLMDSVDDDKAYINYKIFTRDRDRFTDYWNYPNHYYVDQNLLVKTCGYGL